MGRAFFAELTDEIVARIVAEMREREAEPSRSPWMDSKAAAQYAGCSVHSLRKATAARELEFRQDTDGGKCWFRPEWIDEWRGL